MVNNSHPHSHQNVFSNQTNTTKNKDAHGDVGQDKRAFTRARIPSHQPARSHIPMRAQTADNKTPRSQNTPVTKRRTVQLTLWTNPIVKAEIQRIAKREGLSDSAVGAAFLEKALQQNADLEYSALLRPIIESAIKDNLQRGSGSVRTKDGGKGKTMATHRGKEALLQGVLGSAYQIGVP